jgi:uncharacterized protein YpmS
MMYQEVDRGMNMKNRWKVLFFTLLILNAATVVYLYVSLTAPINEKPRIRQENSKEAITFQIHTNKNDLNRAIIHYLEKEENGPIDYQIYLNDDVILYGQFPFLNKTTEMKAVFEPIVSGNGNLILQEKELVVGNLHLPPEMVLNFISHRYQLPKWVIPQPQKRMIILDLQQLKLKGDLKVKADKFDLQRDDIRFTLIVPVGKGVPE